MASKNIKLRKKIERAKLSKAYSRGNSDLNIAYEIKLNKLRANNRSLAKALADQKQETKLWYDEVISLKGQLQEAQERLADTRDNGFEGAVEAEVLRRIQEHSEPLNSAINATMENMVVVIDNFSKVKRLVGTLTRGVRSRSTSYLGSSSSKVSLPKSSGPREPMKSNGGQVTLSSNVSVSASGNNWTSTRYHRVLPMVEGHTLQPAMVAIPKVDIQELWKRKQEERAQGNQEGDMAISIIEEQNSLEMSRPNSSYNQDQEQDEEDLEESENADADARNTSDASDALPSSADPSTHELPFEELSPTRYQDNIFGDEFSRSYNGNNFTSPKQKENAEARCKEENLAGSSEESQEDPLEGPSWRFINIEKPVSKSGRRRSSSAAKKANPGKRRHSYSRISTQKNTRRGRRSSVRLVLQDSACSANDSHVSETENSLVDVSLDGDAAADKSNSECLQSENTNGGGINVNDGAQGDLIQNIQDSAEGLIKDSSLNVGDASYLASPATMLARLEDLEAKRGRKSRSRSTRNSGNIAKVLKHSSDVGSPTVKLRRLSTEEIHSSMYMKERICDDALPMNGNDSYGVSETDSALPLPPPLACSQNLAPLPCDYLLPDQDLTCVMDVSMEMTEPVSKLIPQIAQDPLNPVSADEKTTKQVKEVTTNKFFKPRTKEVQDNSRTPSKDTENSIKTPFDLSLMETTVVMPPYVSTKLEKENIHPSMTSILDNDVKEGRRSLKMVNVSVVLEDVMRTPKLSEHLQSHKQSLSKELPGDTKAVLESPRGRKKKGSNQERASKKSSFSSVESVEEDVDWVPPVKKNQKTVKDEGEKPDSRKRASKSSKLSVGAIEVVKKRSRKSKAPVTITQEKELVSEMPIDKINSSFTKDEGEQESLSPVKDTFSPKKKYKSAAAIISPIKNMDERNGNNDEIVTKFIKPAKRRGRPPGNKKNSIVSRSITPKPTPEVSPNTTLEVTPNVSLENSVQNEEESLPTESKPAGLKIERTPVKRPRVRSKPRIGVGKPRKRKTKSSKLSLTCGVGESLVDLVDLEAPKVNSNLNNAEQQNSNTGMEDPLLDLNNEVVDSSVDKILDQKPEDTLKDNKSSVENKNNTCQDSEPPKSLPLIDVKKEIGDGLESLLRKIKQVTDGYKDAEDGEALPDLGTITFSEEEDKNKNSNQRKNLMTGVEAIKSLNALDGIEEVSADPGCKKELQEEERNRVLEAKKSIDVADLKIEVEEENREHRRRRTTAVTTYKEIPLNCKMRQTKGNSVSIKIKPQVSKSKS
ncbi:uncharacterized protein LOC143025004 [Oratosquilla oratoria]|uniref:uncharacterized protein LOC143025004 n=1 Tax=Oratosquilla oratoria TaxID=337810 RepID=UPI003F768847